VGVGKDEKVCRFGGSGESGLICSSDFVRPVRVLPVSRFVAPASILFGGGRRISCLSIDRRHDDSREVKLEAGIADVVGSLSG
jgi:hypothetical protein